MLSLIRLGFQTYKDLLLLGLFLNTLLYGIVTSVQLRREVNDTHFFRLAANGKYSTKAVYEGFFLGSTIFEPYVRTT